MQAARSVILRQLLINYTNLRSLIIILSVLTSNIAFAQESDKFLYEFIGGNKRSYDNLVSKYSGFDFSEVWNTAENYHVFGIIGDEHRRIKVKLLTVEKGTSGNTQYQVLGKSSVMGNVCDFTGAINIKQIYVFKQNVEQVNESENFPSNLRGIVVADYEFLENTQQNHVGIFSGKVYTKWYLDSLNRIVYDDTDLNISGYTNNAFIGYWNSYEGNDMRICNWGDYRVPLTNSDFDIGTDFFMPSSNYRLKGWDNYIKAWLEDDAKAKTDELHPWWQ